MPGEGIYDVSSFPLGVQSLKVVMGLSAQAYSKILGYVWLTPQNVCIRGNDEQTDAICAVHILEMWSSSQTMAGGDDLAQGIPAWLSSQGCHVAVVLIHAWNWHSTR